MPQLDPQSAELVSLFFAGFSLAVQLSSRKAEPAIHPAPPQRRRRRSKYSDAICAACLAYWHAAKRSSAARNGINTRMTYKAAFAYFATKLRELGIKTVEVFKRIIHAVQSRECEGRRKDLESKRASGAKAQEVEPAKESAPNAKGMRLMERFGRMLVRFGIPLPSSFTHSDNNSSSAAQFA